MPEEIKAVLTGDSSQLQAEFAKAAKVAEDYHARVEQAATSAFRNEMALQRALRAEANGQQEAADAIREKIKLGDSALSLAKRTGLSEENALKLLQRRSGLEKQVAEARQLAAEKAAKAAEQEAMAKAKLAARQENLDRQAANARGYSAASQKRGGIQQNAAEAEIFKAAALAKLDRDVAKAESGFKSGARAAKGYSDGLLQIAYAADDAQYGIRGILNNIPGLVLSLGGGVGLAGVLSLVALAASFLGPKIAELFGAEDKKAAEEYADRLDQIRKKALEAAAARGVLRATTFVDSLHNEEKAMRLWNEQADHQQRLLDAKKETLRGLIDAQDDLARAQIEASKTLSPADKVNQKGDLDLAAARRQAAAERAQIQAGIDQAEREKRNAAQAAQGGNENIDQIKAQIAADEAERARLKGLSDASDRARNDLVAANAEMARLAAAKPESPTGGIAAGGWETEERKKAVADQKALIADLEKTRDSAGEGEKKRQADLEAGIEIQKKGLEDLIKKQKELIATANQATNKFASIKFAGSDQLNGIDEVAKKRQAALKEKTDLEAKKADEPEQRRRKEQADAMADLQREIAAMRLRASGQDEAAKAMEAENALKRESVTLAERLKISEDAALSILREKASLQKEIEERGQANARRDFMLEGRVSILRAQGHKSLADALTKEASLQQEAKREAERQGISEAEALKRIHSREQAITNARRAATHASKIGGDRHANDVGGGLRATGGLRSGGLLSSEEARWRREHGRINSSRTRKEDEETKKAQRLLKPQSDSPTASGFNLDPRKAGLLVSVQAERQEKRRMKPKQDVEKDKAAAIAEKLLSNSDEGLKWLKQLGVF